jgi:hypothetical protein
MRREGFQRATAKPFGRARRHETPIISQLISKGFRPLRSNVNNLRDEGKNGQKGEEKIVKKAN